MSIHHVVTVHCDTCLHWEHVDGESARQRRRRGWRMSRDPDSGCWRHSCPKCTAADLTDTSRGLTTTS